MHNRVLTIVPDGACGTHSHKGVNNDGVHSGGHRAFLGALDIIRSQIRALIDAVNALKCERAWLAKKELLRSLDFAAYVLGNTPPSNRESLVRQFNSILPVAMTAINAAPTLSVGAISQIRDTPGARIEHLSAEVRQARRADWYVEEDRWTTERVIAGPLPTVYFP